MKQVLKPFLPFLAAGALMLSLQACNKQDSGISDPEGSGNVSLTQPAPHTGTVPDNPDPDPVPHVSDIYTQFVGLWREPYLGKTFAFLNDGRVAGKQEGKLPNIGYFYQSSTPDWYFFKWALADEERLNLVASGNALDMMIDHYTLVGNANNAEAFYNEIHNEVQTYAEQQNARFPTGPVTNTTHNPEDPKPNNVIPGATVFTNGTHFQASYTSTSAIELPAGKIKEFDGYSRTDVWLMPNGRFFMQIWLWDQVHPQDVESSYTHEFSWGKYTIIKGNDVIKGDIINFYYDTGESAAYRTTVGQTNFLTKEVMYVNK